MKWGFICPSKTTKHKNTALIINCMKLHLFGLALHCMLTYLSLAKEIFFPKKMAVPKLLSE